MKTIEVNEKEFDDIILKNNLVLVDFNANWCGPCRMLKPIIDEYSDNSSVKVCSVDIDKNEELASKYGIYSIPCLILFKDGKEIKRNVGLINMDQLKDFVGE